MRHSYTAVTTATKSVNSSPQRLPGFSAHTHEIPLDPRAHYTISYVPGMSEHSIETGKTFEEAKLKIVTLACELEKVNTYNYTLVKENEVLRVQANKSEREKDLETKLAIVLAENEKLNRIIEEVYEVYMASRNNTVVHHEYEHRITELYADLEQWKKKYNALESQNNIVELQHAIQDLKHKNEMLSEQLTRKDRDLEAMRARLNSLGALEVNHQDLNQRVSILSSENQALHRELDAMRLQYGKADALQLKISTYDNKIKTVLDENEKLNSLLRAKCDEVLKLKDALAHAHDKHAEISVTMNRHVEEQKKSSAINQKEIANRMQSLADENDHLHHELERLQREISSRESHILVISQKLTETEKKSQGQDLQRQQEIDQIRIRIQSEMSTQFNSQRQGLESQLNSLLLEKRELEGRGGKIAAEVDRLQAIIRDLRAENDQLKHKASHLESYKFTSDKELEEIRKQFEAVKALNLQNREFQAKFNAERTAYETQIHQMSQIISDLERKTQLLSVENERVSTLNVQRLSVIEDLKKNSNEEKYKLEVYGLKNQMEMIKSRALDSEQYAVQYSNQKSIDQAKIAELSQLVAGYKAESDNLKSLLEKRRGEVEALTHQNEDLRHMCEKINQSRMSSSGVKVESIEIMQNKISELEISRNEYQRQAERNSLEVSRKNKELVDKIHEMDVLKLKYEEALANYQALNNQLYTKLSVKY